MKKKTVFQEKDKQVLCAKCAMTLYDGGEHHIRRVDPNQAVKGHCSICGKPNETPKGYDYYVKRK